VYLVQILLPVFDNHGAPQPPKLFQQVSQELTERFGGLTPFTRAPAEGRPWWEEYRRKLEQRFRQEAIVVRAQEVEQL
jgi:hypothetical protein